MCMMLFLATVYPSLSLSFSPFLSHVLWLSLTLSLSSLTHSLTHSRNTKETQEKDNYKWSMAPICWELAEG